MVLERTTMYISIVFSILLVLVVFSGYVDLVDQCPNVKKQLGAIRKRRHLTFPEGSTASVTASVTKAFMTHAPSGWFTVVEVEIVYHLPDANFTNAQWRRKLHHRQKREFWDRIESAVEIHNINGRACLLRSICEARSLLAPPGKSLVHDILRAIFTAPTHEEDFTNEVGDIYSELLDPNFCDKIYECPISIIDFMLSMNKPKN